jgi:hypothetical protein
MKSPLTAGLLAGLVLPILAMAASDPSSVEQKLMQMERDYAQAIVK